MSRFRASAEGPFLAGADHLSQRTRDLNFAMQCNGWFFLNKGEWVHDTSAASLFTNAFNGPRIVFSGPNATDRLFSGTKGPDSGPDRLIPAFDQDPVADVIRKYRKIDENQASRISFIFGALVRYLSTNTIDCDQNRTRISEALAFVANMTKLGDAKSGEAIASAITMYVISGGSLSPDEHFIRNVYQMGEAVSEDPVVPIETRDLGLSQVARLRSHAAKMKLVENGMLPDIKNLEAVFDGFPTVGAEFHFPSESTSTHPKFLQRLALLNMSQHQADSFVQFSRNDRGVIEVRMNPSIYPVTITNWHYMKSILPELNHAFFTFTINRSRLDFDWTMNEDLLEGLIKVGMLSYAGKFEGFSRAEKSEEINVGSRYLGQTVKLNDGQYEFTGNWGGGQGDFGQLGIYIGYGDNLPELAYYLSMALAEPDIIKNTSFPRNLRSLHEALAIRPADGKGLFARLNNLIRANKRLLAASEAGAEMEALLAP